MPKIHSHAIQFIQDQLITNIKSIGCSTKEAKGRFSWWIYSQRLFVSVFFLCLFVRFQNKHHKTSEYISLFQVLAIFVVSELKLSNVEIILKIIIKPTLIFFGTHILIPGTRELQSQTFKYRKNQIKHCLSCRTPCTGKANNF